MHPIVRRGAILLAAPALTVSALVGHVGAGVRRARPGSGRRRRHLARWPAPRERHHPHLRDEFDGVAVQLRRLRPVHRRRRSRSTRSVARTSPIDRVGRRHRGGHRRLHRVRRRHPGTAGAAAKAARPSPRSPATTPPASAGRTSIADLESTVAHGGRDRGSVQDRLDPDDEFAPTTPTPSARPAPRRALDAAGSDLTDSVTDFLLAQQCEDGFFRQQFSAAGRRRPDLRRRRRRAGRRRHGARGPRPRRRSSTTPTSPRTSPTRSPGSRQPRRRTAASAATRACRARTPTAPASPATRSRSPARPTPPRRPPPGCAPTRPPTSRTASTTPRPTSVRSPTTTPRAPPSRAGPIDADHRWTSSAVPPRRRCPACSGRRPAPVTRTRCSPRSTSRPA